METLRQYPAEVVCVILDLTMPGMRFAESCWAMREIKPGLKIVLSSGYRKQAIARRFTGGLVDEFLMKPYQSGELARVLRVLLNPDQEPALP